MSVDGSDGHAGTQERFDTTWQVTPDLLGILSPAGIFAATNPAWEKTLGYSREEIESRRFFDFVHAGDQERTRQAFADIQAGKPILGFENRYRHKDGSYRWLSWNCVPENNRFYCSARDITQGKQNEASLKSREEEAALREQFIAVLGHDLRNPLAAVQAANNLLLREELSGRGTLLLSESNKSIRRMSRLIGDLMDFARSRLGDGLSLDLQTCDIGDTLKDIAREIGIAHPDVLIETEIDIDGAIPCDMARLGQMTSNLIANAVSHGGADKPVRLLAKGSPDYLTISVSNAGEPIPDAVRERLFEPFVREAVRPSQEGLGLGLFICSQIAQAHGGSIAVDSTEEKTVFTFTMRRGSDSQLVGWS